jgi:hypothetical protein
MLERKTVVGDSSMLWRRWLSSVASVVLVTSLGAGMAEALGTSPSLRIPGPNPAYIQVPHAAALNPPSAITVEMWLKLDTATPVPATDCSSLVGKDWMQSYWFGVCSGKLRFYPRGSSSARTDTASVPIGVWSHVAVTYDGSFVRFFINGNQTNAFAATGAMTASTAPLRLGSDVQWNHSPVGYLDDIRIWRVARTVAEIEAAMTTSFFAVDPTGLVAFWTMDGDAQDAVGGHHGAVVGTASFESGPAPACGFKYFVPTVGHLPGSSAGSVWKSDVTLRNNAPTPANASVYLLPRGDQSNLSTPFASVTIAPSESLQMPDVVLSTFGNSNLAAALRICSDKELLVIARTFNSSAAGTFGYGASGPPLARSQAPGQVRYLTGITEDALFRSNMGFLNTGSGSAQVTVRIWDANGNLVSSPRTYNLQGYGHIQRNRILRDFTSEQLAGCSARIEVAGNAVFTYVVVIDNALGDGSYYLAE